MHVSAFAPGRVNLIGDHTDHTGGLVLPMAIGMGTTVTGERGGDHVELHSHHDAGLARVALAGPGPAAAMPSWARYVAGVVAELGPTTGFTGEVTTTLPIGAGLSSSAALTVSVALALGADPGDPLELARLCQRAEQRALGVPCGIMDQLISIAGVEGAALVIDTGSATWEPVTVPAGVEVVIVDSGERRALAASGYAAVRDRCVAAHQLVGDLKRAAPTAWEAIADPSIGRAARHVIGENRRVLAMARALRDADPVTAGRLMGESHQSLAQLGVSTPRLDELVTRLGSLTGVFGARLTGAGFGGCVVALTEPGAVAEGWRARPAAGAWVRVG
jgi:galactokinase